ncbi:putative NADH dehydrogenase [Hyphodiscus hymeniophilus]|uniref:NADH dehydrogenase n=1 Tax=Hyphodiscus hymeniophilus TaxID=353542 RepID=A0A9P6VNC5_9HELO|nr:putative NADH dehydrogenase [Hyphodiscus hymeniophilus]
MVTTRSQVSTFSPPTPTTSSSSSVTDASSDEKQQTIAIIGTGWAGWTLAQDLNPRNARIVLISPHRTMALTPLLASAACAIFDFRLAEEPVRRRNRSFQKYQANVSSIDFGSKTISCTSAIGSQRSGLSQEDIESGKGFEVQYDKLILAPGCETNTFGTPGVKEHALFMKSVKDARTLRERLLDCFEEASLPTLSDQQRKDILHFAIVGGGPTGVELAAELDELVQQHLLAVYPHLKGLPTISVYDVADRLLGQFGEKLSQYAMSQFTARENVTICTERHIEEVHKDALIVKEEGRVGFGVCVWAVGNKACKMVEELNVRKTEKGIERILTDSHLRVLQPDSKSGNKVLEGVWALGDAADIQGNSLPTTAEVAVQKAKWLAKCINSGEMGGKFEYKNKALVAYIGRGDGVIEGNQDWTGASAWLAWRSGSLEWTRSWRRRVMIFVNWVANWIDGREVARR